MSPQEEGDKVKVFGAPDEIQGGLFKFINEVNNPNLEDQSKYAVVVAHVSVTGQFMLRELLESGQSTTHRLAVNKDRVMFILSVNNGEDLQPQFFSRAHEIFDCQ